MLGQTWRIVVQNATGSPLGASDTITVVGVPWAFNSSGAVTYGAEVTLVPATSGNSLASNAYYHGATQSSNTNVGVKMLLEANITPSAGQLNFWYQESPDGGTTWPADGQGNSIGVMTVTATGAQPTQQTEV